LRSPKLRRTSCRAFRTAGKHSMSKRLHQGWFHNVSTPTVEKLLNIEKKKFTKNWFKSKLKFIGECGHAVDIFGKALDLMKVIRDFFFRHDIQFLSKFVVVVVVGNSIKLQQTDFGISQCTLESQQQQATLIIIHSETKPCMLKLQISKTYL